MAWASPPICGQSRELAQRNCKHHWVGGATHPLGAQGATAFQAFWVQRAHPESGAPGGDRIAKSFLSTRVGGSAGAYRNDRAPAGPSTHLGTVGLRPWSPQLRPC